jgi:hypothetical protein
MAGQRSDESGFPRPIGRSLGQPGITVMAGRKRSRSEKADEGDLAILPVDHDDVLLVSTPEVVKLLEQVVKALERNTKAIEALQRR